MWYAMILYNCRIPLVKYVENKVNICTERNVTYKIFIKNVKISTCSDIKISMKFYYILYISFIKGFASACAIE